MYGLPEAAPQHNWVYQLPHWLQRLRCTAADGASCIPELRYAAAGCIAAAGYAAEQAAAAGYAAGRVANSQVGCCSAALLEGVSQSSTSAGSLLQIIGAGAEASLTCKSLAGPAGVLLVCQDVQQHSARCLVCPGVRVWCAGMAERQGGSMPRGLWQT